MTMFANISKISCNQYSNYAVLILMVLLLFLVPEAALAQSTNCTSSPNTHALGTTGSGLILAITTQIETLLNGIGSTLFDQIRSSSYYQNTLQAALVLAVVFYGVMIVLDLKQFRPGEILIMMIKMAIIVWVAGPDGWNFFSNTLGSMLWGLATELINVFTGTSIGTSASSSSGLTATNLGAPLAVLNNAASRVLSSHFLITIIASPFVLEYGFIISVILAWGAGTFLFALVGAIFTYIKTMVGLWFMFAMAPMFVILLLFQRTARLFDGWISIMVGLVLELVLLFAFLAFFIVVLTASLENILLVDWCLTPRSILGGFVTFNFWEPVSMAGGLLEIIECKKGMCEVENTVTQAKGVVPFPINIIDVMFFVLSAYMSHQYTTFVSQIATQLSSSGLRMGGAGEALRQYFRTRGWGGDQIAMRGIGKLGRMTRGLGG